MSTLTTNAITIIHNSNLFTAPPNSLLIHACNTVGSWCSGVALAFKTHYPAAHTVYVSHCEQPIASLIGTTLLIPPQAADIAAGRTHWVACVFTSVAFGAKVDPPDVVLRNTASAMQDLQRQVEEFEKSTAAAIPGEWHSAKINSVRFKVPWGDTCDVIEGVLRGSGRVVRVYEYEEQASGGRGG